MSDEGIKISEFPFVDELHDECCFPVISEGQNKRITKKNLFKYNSNNYSKEEQIIGTWIDGKPVYRRIYSLDDPEVIEIRGHKLIDVDFIDSCIKSLQIEHEKKTTEYRSFDTNELKLISIESGTYGGAPYHKQFIFDYVQLTGSTIEVYAILEYTKKQD